eukprot:6011576-Amphidinium_carterae.1
MSMGFSMKSLLADFGITVGTLVKESMKEFLRSGDFLRLLSSKSFRTEERTRTTKARPGEMAVHSMGTRQGTCEGSDS